MYEYEKNNKQSEVQQLMQENSELKKTVAIMKQDHYKELTKLKRDLEEALGKVDYYEELLKNGRSRAGSTVDDISRMHTESKTGESTIESDKLANILKCKEDNIRLLMQELKSSNHNLETAKFEESKSSAVSYNSLRVKSEVKGSLKHHQHCETCQCEIKTKSGVKTGLKETCSTQRDVVQSNHINIAIRKNKLSSELTPEFSGPRGISMDSEKFKDKLSILRKLDSSFLDNSLVSEEGPKE
jgi:lipoate synthase